MGEMSSSEWILWVRSRIKPLI